ncbi:hypothetical protein GCM10009633_00010 [Janibacter melonis]
MKAVPSEVEAIGTAGRAEPAAVDPAAADPEADGLAAADPAVVGPVATDRARIVADATTRAGVVTAARAQTARVAVTPSVIATVVPLAEGRTATHGRAALVSCPSRGAGPSRPSTTTSPVASSTAPCAVSCAP